MLQPSFLSFVNLLTHRVTPDANKIFQIFLNFNKENCKFCVT